MLTFLGRLNFRDPPAQVFRAGVMKAKGEPKTVTETIKVPSVDEAGKPVLDENGAAVMVDKEISGIVTPEWSFQTKDINKAFDAGDDEEYLLKTYPTWFKKA